MLLLSLGRGQRAGGDQVFGALHLQTGMQEAKLFNFVSPGTHLRQVLVDCPPPLEPPVPRGDDHHVGLQPRLLHPQHLDGIWTGQTQYRLPYAPLSEYPEPWS